MPAMNHVIPDCPQAIDEKLFDAIAREMWLHYGRNGALDWHGLEPLLSGTGLRSAFCPAGSGGKFADDMHEEPTVDQIIVPVASQQLNASLHANRR